MFALISGWSQAGPPRDGTPELDCCGSIPHYLFPPTFLSAWPHFPSPVPWFARLVHSRFFGFAISTLQGPRFPGKWKARSPHQMTTWNIFPAIHGRGPVW